MATNWYSAIGLGPKTPPRRPPQDAGGNLYFAYGSNLHVAQMAQRCPESVFKGKATLLDYRWQINQRGVANVVPSKDHCVEGLVYLVSRKDERALDRAEGVSRSLYQRHFLPVALEPHERFLDFKSSRVAQLLGADQNDTGAMHGEFGAKGKSGSAQQEIKALVYVSGNYKNDGEIREEYIVRMKKATADAVALGVSQSFVDSIAPHLDRKDIDPPTTSTQQDGQVTAQSSARERSDGKGNNKRRSQSPEQPATKQPATEQPTTKQPATELEEATKASERQHQIPEGDSSLVEFQNLRHVNRQLHIDSGLRFPKSLLDKILQARTEPIGRDGNIKEYVVLFVENINRKGADPAIEIRATPDRELANEAALAHFRDVWAQHCSKLETIPVGQWVENDGGRDDNQGDAMEWRPEGDARRVAMEWSHDSDACTHLSAAVPGTDTRFSVWVEPRERRSYRL